MTIYDIAREAGVSASSVSRVVNNKPGVNKEMRAKIQTLLKKYDYTPNVNARDLVNRNSRVVGILVADVRTQHHIEGAYHIAHELAMRGHYSFILNTGNSDAERVEGIRTLVQHQVEAAVLMGSIFQDEAVRSAIEKHLPKTPMFFLNGVLDLPNVYSVISDERSGVHDCVKLLASKGHRNIVWFVDRPTPSSLLKTQGFKEGMRELGWHEKDLWIYTGIDGTLDASYAAMKRALLEHPALNGVICSLDILACGAMRALQEQGCEIPRDVSVIGIDNSVYADICTPRLTSLDNMIFESGVTIAHKLIDCLEGHPTNQRTLLYTSIIEREST